MPEALWIKLVGTIPGILWVAFAATVYFTLRDTIIQRLIPRLTAVRALGIEMEFAGALLEQAQERSQATPLSPAAKRQTLGRLEHAADLLQGARILWVDDHPEQNSPLIKLFRTTGMEVEVALSTDEATALLRRRPYDILISDVARDRNPQAGIEMLRVLERYNIDVPVLIYTGSFDPERGLDRRIFAATTAPADLVHYVIDLMERTRLASL